MNAMRPEMSSVESYNKLKESMCAPDVITVVVDGEIAVWAGVT